MRRATISIGRPLPPKSPLTRFALSNIERGVWGEGAKQPSCPTCKKPGDWLAGSHGPFCSHRCKLIDLGKWLGGEHVISEPLRPGLPQKSAGLPTGGHLDQPETE